MRILSSLFLLLVPFLLLAETEFADPPPAIDNIRKMVFVISKGSDDEMNHLLSSVNNVLKYYGPENVEIKVVAYYHGLGILKKSSVDVRKRVEALMTYDVEFIACGNTMRTTHVTKEQLLDGVEIVTAGIVEINEAILKGYNCIIP